MADPQRIPDHLQVAREPRGPHPALLFAHAQWVSRCRSCLKRRDCRTSRIWSALRPNEQMTPEFHESEQQIPAIDPDGPWRQTAAAVKPGAILIYLAEDWQVLFRQDARRYETISGSCGRWAASGRCSAAWPSSTSLPEGTMRTSVRVIATWLSQSVCSGVLNGRLATRQWIMGDDYTIADIATFPWAQPGSASMVPVIRRHR